MKKLNLFVIIILMFSLNGCAYQDMNRLQFVTMSMIDANEAGEVVIYTELFSSDRGNGEDLGIAKRFVVQGKGDTVGEAFYIMQASASLPLAYDVSKSTVFTENIAEQGLGDYIGAFEINQRITLKQFIFISEGDPVDLINMKLEDEEYIGVYLDEMMIFQESQSRVISIYLNEYLNNRLIGCRVNIVPMIRKVDESTGDRLEVSGAAVLMDDKMVEKLSPDEVALYKFLKGKIKTGDWTVENPQDKGKLISLLILSSKTKSDIEYNEEEIVVNTKINIVYSIQSAQGEFDAADDKVEAELIKIAEEDLKKKCTELFEKYQEKDIDIFNIETQLKRKYPSLEVKNILEKTTLNLDVNVRIDGSENMTKTK